MEFIFKKNFRAYVRDHLGYNVGYKPKYVRLP